LLTELNCGYLPQAPGVYVLRVVKMGDVDAAVTFLRDVITKARWSEVGMFLKPRLRRLGRLKGSRCPVVYIGSTASLRGRCRDLAGKRYIAFILVLLVLLISGTVLDYRYRVAGSEVKVRTLEGLKSGAEVYTGCPKR